MSSRLRSLDSKISFFAFADIITAVSGVLIFVALLLATDLGQPTDSSSGNVNKDIERRLEATIAQQAEVDAQNLRLQALLATANTSPDLDALQSDITGLRSQLSEAQKKQAGVARQMADSRAAIAAHDKLLGLTGLKASVDETLKDVQSIALQDVKARSEMENLSQQVEQMQNKLLKLRERDGQLWLIPDKSTTTKEPILVAVAGGGVVVERFDRPDQRKQWAQSEASAGFETYLHQAKAVDQYVVFLVKPSGIGLFQSLVKSARDSGFDVGFDALEEDREIHFSTPPTIDDSTPLPGSPVAPPQSSPTQLNGGTNPPLPAAASAPQPRKSFWRRIIDLGRQTK